MILLIATMAGCIVYYEQPGRTTADFARDKGNCEAVAEKEYVRKGTKVCEEVDLCLLSKGWKRSQQDPGSQQLHETRGCPGGRISTDTLR